jgi:hypothetical protein
MIIGSAAHFVVCDCGTHGRIVLADGSTTNEVASIQAALAVMDALIKGNHVTDVEVPILRWQINSSRLPNEQCQAGPYGQLASDIRNVSLRLTPGTEDSADRHKHGGQWLM